MKSLRLICFMFITIITLISFGSIARSQTLFGLAGCGPDAESTLYTINTFTGVATAVGPVGFSRCGGMDFDANGTLFAGCRRLGTSNGVLITIDPTTGTGTEVGEMCGSAGGLTTDFSFRNADEVLFGIIFGTGGNCTSNGYQTINTTNGVITTSIGISGNFGCCGFGTAFSPTDTLFFADEDVDLCKAQMTPIDGDLYTVDQSTGVLTQIATLAFPNPPFNHCARPNAMDFQPETGVLFVSIVNGGPNFPEFPQPRSNYIATTNTTTGEVTVMGQTVECLDAIAFGPSPPRPIPTLSEWGLIAMAGILGIVGFMIMRRRKVAA